MKKLLVSAMLAAGALVAVTVPLPGVAASNVNIQLNFGPPAPRYEAVPAPRHGYVWSPGYWAWDGYRHAWIPGHWEAVRPGYSYFAPTWVERSGRWHYQPSRWDPIPGPAAGVGGIQLNFGPPAPRYEPVPAPRSGYLWSPGYWAWDGRHHVWVGGHWERARPGYSYRAPAWVQRDGRWYHQSARWDSDRDGIPDHRDRTPYGTAPRASSSPGRGFGGSPGPGFGGNPNVGAPYGSGPTYWDRNNDGIPDGQPTMTPRRGDRD